MQQPHAGTQRTLSVVVPTYNEAENLPQLISVLLQLPVPELQIVVVDDNSPDGTGRIADELAAQYASRLHVFHRPGKQGFGRACLYGFAAALELGTQAIAQMDADFSHPPQKLPELLGALEHYDLALGSRYVPGGGLDEHWPAWRRGLSAFGNHYARAILGMPIRDITGGFRVYRRETLQALP
jgi:dolichol-phosphate mannosyltransferase